MEYLGPDPNHPYANVIPYGWNGWPTDIQWSTTGPEPDPQLYNVLPMVPGGVPPGYWMFDQGGTWTNNQPHTPPTGLGPTPGTHIQPHPVQTSDRKRLRAAKDRLRGWAKQYSRIDLPTFETALTTAFGVISGAREAITAKPRLCKRARRRTVLSPKNDKEHRRNQRERELLEALSRYYPVPQGQKEWTRSALLSIVLRELKGLPSHPPPVAGGSSES